MKRLLQLFIPIVVLLSACTKEQSLEEGTNNPGPGLPGGPGGPNTTGYFIKCKIGGVAKTFNVGAMAVQETEDTTTVTMVAGANGTDPQNSEAFTFFIISVDPLAAGNTYKVDDVSGEYEVFATYAVTSTAIPYLTFTGIPVGTPFRVNITSLSSTEIAGTFSGTLFEIDINAPTPPTNPAQKAVTEGEFRVKFP
jgi:hypothetical protein